MPNYTSYKNNYLTDILFRIDYEPILSLETGVIDDSLKDNILKLSLNVYKEIESKQVEIKITKENEEIKKVKKYNSFIFTDKENTTTLTLTYNFLLLRQTKYQGYAKLNSVISNILNAFNTYYNVPLINRVALRYVNQIKIKSGNPLNWKDFISTSLTTAIDRFFDRDSKRNISRYISQVIINEEDFKINFNWGIPNSEYPNKIARKEFLLDFDCYATNIEPNKILSCIDKFKEKIKLLFEESIKDKLRSLMNE